VDVVQELLKDLGHPCGPIDGEKNALTEAALKAYQDKNGIDPNGDPDDAATRRKLYTEYLEKYSDAGLGADRFMDTPTYGLGDGVPVVEVDGPCEINRRVAFFTFNEKRLPPLPYGSDAEMVEFYEEIQQDCSCETPAPKPPNKGAGAAAENGDPFMEQCESCAGQEQDDSSPPPSDDPDAEHAEGGC